MFLAVKEATVPVLKCRWPLGPSGSATWATAAGSTTQGHRPLSLYQLCTGDMVRWERDRVLRLERWLLKGKQPVRSYATIISTSQQRLLNIHELEPPDLPRPLKVGQLKKQTSVPTAVPKRPAVKEPVASVSAESHAVANPEPLRIYSYKDYANPPPEVIYVRDEAKADELVAQLEGPLGFDMEWRVMRQMGHERLTAVVQLCDMKTILVIQIHGMNRFPQKVQEVLENESVYKCGANIRGDALKLYRDYGLLCRSCAELGLLAHSIDPEFAQTHKRKVVALKEMVEVYLIKDLLKDERGPGAARTSNWEAKPLSAVQLTYAANDVHSGLMVFRRLRRLALAQGKTLEQLKPNFSHDLLKDFQSGKLTSKLRPGVTPSATAKPPAMKAPLLKETAAPKTRTIVATAATPLPGAKTVSTQATTTTEAPKRPVKSSPPVARQVKRKADMAMEIMEEVILERRQVEDGTTHIHVQAYNMWARGASIYEICTRYRRTGCGATLMVLQALRANPDLPYDLEKVEELANQYARAKTFFDKWQSSLKGE